jgi:hypothetical protein
MQARGHLAHTAHVPFDFGIDPAPFADPNAYPWAYPVDAGWVSAWPFATENPNPTEWPVHYDPTMMGRYPANYPGFVAAGNLSDLVQQAYGGAQSLGQGLMHAPGLVQVIPGLAPSPSQSSGSLSDRASGAADAVRTQANQVGDDARRTMSDVSRHTEDTAKQVQTTAKTIQYVVLGVGVLGAVAILFHLIQQSE